MNLLDNLMCLTANDLPSYFGFANNEYSAQYNSIYGKLQPEQISSVESLDVVIQQALTVSYYNVSLIGHYIMSLSHFSNESILLLIHISVVRQD